MPRRRGFALVELAILAIVVVGIVAIAAVVLTGLRHKARDSEDAEQIKDIHKGLVLSGQSGPDSYLLPSMVDRGNTTLPDDAVAAKDLPGHMMSLLIYDGFFSPEMCVSPSETNPRIQAARNYAYDNPPSAVTPSQALWDPSFRGTPDDPGAGGMGNLSYAIMPPAGARRAHFTNDFQANEVVLANRGPAYTAQGSGASLAWTLAPARAPDSSPDTPTGLGSFALGRHGGSWSGNVAYNDNHVAFEKDCCPTSTPFTFSGLPRASKSQLDNLFVNEDDITRAPCSETLEGAAGRNTNNFLRLWTAGKQREHDDGWQDRVKRGMTTYSDGELATITPWYD